MFKPELAQPGDILLYEPKDGDVTSHVIAAGTLGPFSHSALYVGNGRIIESHKNTGVIEKDLNPKWYPHITVVRVLYPVDIEKVIEWHRSKIDTPYDPLSMPSVFFRGTVCRLPGLRWLRKRKPRFNNPNKLHCTELNAGGFLEGGGYTLCLDIHVMSASPNDIYRNFEKSVFRVC